METVLFRFAPDGGVPNNPHLPVVLVEGAFDPGLDAAVIRAELEACGWTGTWTWQVFDAHHYHTNAHEVLVVSRGWADLVLGGPSQGSVRVVDGDAVILPAGTGHCQVAASPDFQICGAYPPGQQAYDTIWAGPVPDPADAARIAAVPLPRTDPLRGASGPLHKAWAL